MSFFAKLIKSMTVSMSVKISDMGVAQSIALSSKLLLMKNIKIISKEPLCSIESKNGVTDLPTAWKSDMIMKINEVE